MAATNGIFHDEVFGKRNFDALDLIYTKDARILPPGGPMVTGRDAIKEFWTGLIQATNATAVSLATVDAMPAGDGVVEIGAAVLTLGTGAETTQMHAKYVVYWRQEDGRWKWHVDIWNPNA
jgi:ketosteroid isomerase-like protein